MAIVLNPSGVVGEVPDDQLQAALAQGYAPAPADAATRFLTARANREKYGTTSQQIATGLEGFADAATLGLSSMFERAAGVDPEGMRLRPEVNPVTHGVTAAAGVLAPILATGGIAAPEEAGALGLRGAAEMTAPSLISRAGAATTRALAPEGAGALRTIAAKAAGAGVEGAAYGVGDVVHDAAAGDPTLTPGTAAERIGLSTLAGGALGGAFGGVEYAGAKALASAREASGRIRDAFVERYPEIGAKLSGASEDDIRNLLKNRQRLHEDTPLVDIVRESREPIPEPAPLVPGEVPKEAIFEKGVPPPRPVLPDVEEPGSVPHLAAELATDLGQQMEATKQASRDAGAEFRPEESAQLIDGAVHPATASAEALRFASRVDELATRMRERGPDRFNQGTAARLEDIRDGLLRDVQGPRGESGQIQAPSPASETFQKLNEAKRLIFDESKKLSGDMATGAITKSAVLDLHHALKVALEDESVWGAAGARQSAYNAAHSEFRSAQKDFDRYFTRKASAPTGSDLRVPDNAKIEKFLKGIDEQKFTHETEAFLRYQEATRVLHDEIAKTAKGIGADTYDRAAHDIAQRSTGETLEAAGENARVAARAKSTIAKHNAAVRDFNEKLRNFNGTEAERKDAARTALKEFRAAEDVREAAHKQSMAEFKAATRAQTGEIKDAARNLRAGGRWNGFMDIIGAGAVGHAPILAPLFVGYRAAKYLGSPEKTARLLAGLENSSIGSTLGRLIPGASTRSAALSLATAGAAHGIGRSDPEQAIGAPPQIVAEGAAPLAMRDLLSDAPGTGKSLLHEVGASVSPRLVEAMTDMQATVYAKALGKRDDTEVRRLLRESVKLGYGGPFTSAADLYDAASRGLVGEKDPKAHADTAAIVDMAARAARVRVDDALAPVAAETVAAAHTHGTQAAFATDALRDVRARLGPSAAGALAPALRKVARAPMEIAPRPSAQDQEHASSRGALNAMLADGGGEPHEAASPEQAAAVAVLARHVEDTAERVHGSARAAVAGKVPAELRGTPPTAKETLDMMDRVRALASDPENLASVVDRHTASLGAHAPQAGMHAANTLVGGVQYLASQLPPTRPPTLQDPTAGAPSNAARASWGAKAYAVQHPFEALAEGPTADTVATVKAVYPTVFAQWSDAAVMALAEAIADGKPPPYQAIQRISTAIGRPLVPGQQPALVAIRPPPPPAPVAPKSPAGRKMASGDSLRTNTQRAMADS